MKISFLQAVLVSVLMSVAYAGEVTGQEILDTKISLDLQKGSLRDALLQIEKIAEVKFLFHSQLVPVNERISIVVKQERLADVLDKILTSRKIRYEADGNQIILTKENEKKTDQSSILLPDEENQYSKLVTGTILDEASQPLPGVNVVIKGTTTGTSSDAEGKYSLSVPDENTIIVVSFIGYATQEVVVGNRTEINVTLINDITTLSEVMVVGYGTQKKTDIISSISSVQGSDLKLQSMPNFEAGLQGLAAGVSVQSQSGAPGAPVRILIRGANSINLTTDPLYIIDGMPISMGSGGLGSSNLSPMSLINQNDIESIEILKDAAATSIYGSRASNGVILITTKSGKKGDASTSINYSTGFSTLNRTPEDVGYANTKEWFSIMDEAYSKSADGAFTMDKYYTNAPGTSPTFSTASPLLSRSQAEEINTNWYKELFRVGSFQSFNLSTTKGSDRSAFYLSANYRKDKGVEENNDLERFTVRSNMDFNATENLTIGAKLTFGYTKNNQRNSITSISINALPWLPVRELENSDRYFNAYIPSNPIAKSDPDNRLSRVDQYRTLGGVNINYKLPFVKGLSVRSELSGDVLQSRTLNWSSRNIRLANNDTDYNTPESGGTEELVTFNSINYNAYTTYDKSFGDHSLTVLAGVEGTRSSQITTSLVGNGLIGKFQELGSPTESKIRSGKGDERYLLGYFARVNYKFKQRYLFGASARRDGSSAFTEENRWGTFLAGSAGWIISEESFMSFLQGNTLLKLRGSYGETGNQFLPNNLDVITYNNALPSVTYGSSAILGANGTIPINIGVQSLQWETTRSSDIGLDFGVLKNRINGSFAYYHRYISKQLLKAPIPPSTGLSTDTGFINTFEDLDANSIWGNFGDMVNSGFELELHSINIDKDGFRWTTDINLALNRNEIKSLAADIDRTGSGLPNIIGNAVSIKGKRRYVWFIAENAGIDPKTGLPLIYARDQDKFAATGETAYITTNLGERVKIEGTDSNIKSNPFYQDGKSGDPKYQGGITNTLQYKGFELNALVSFSGGNYILDYDRQLSTVVNPSKVILKEVYDQSWRKPGDIAKYQQIREGVLTNGYSQSNVYHNGELYKGDYIRLRSVQLAYSLSNAVVERIKMKSLRLYVSGSNLFTITDYPGLDPEGTGNAQTPGFVQYANAIPQLKTITIGVDLRF